MDVAIHQLVEVKGSENKLIAGCGATIKHNKGARLPQSVTTTMAEVTCAGCLQRVEDYRAAKREANERFGR